MKQEVFVWGGSFNVSLVKYLEQIISDGYRIDHVIDDVRQYDNIARAIIIATKIEKP